MIYLVTLNQELFENDSYTVISPEESLEILSGWGPMIQIDSETTGRDPHINDLLCFQIGNREGDKQIVIDCTTVDIKFYKHILEEYYCIGQNLKFDLQFLYNYGIIPRKIYDTMIVEQFLHLGYPSGKVSYSLASIAERRLGLHLDKSVRGEIIWRGLDTRVIEYAAADVQHLCEIMKSQIEDCRKANGLIGAKLECDAVPAIAYLEWCGIKLDEQKWKQKMLKDVSLRDAAKKALDEYVVSKGDEKYYYIERQGDLFEGFNLTPKCNINWDSPKQVVDYAKHLGFDTSVKDKKSGEDKDSVLEKQLKGQKGIDDEFLNLYFEYKEHQKVCTTYGQGHLDAINPKTGRLCTAWHQLGAASGRMSCGSRQPNTDLAKFKKLSPSRCTYQNLQQLPSDEITRSCFVAPAGFKMVSADFSAEESRLGADIYQDKEFLKEFTEGSKDTHNMFAWIVYNKECKELGCKDVTEVKSKAPQWRKKVKYFEFGYMFGAAAPTLSQTAGCSVEEAQEVVDKLDKAFVGMTDFARKGSKFVRENGYIIMCKHTGHRMYWWDHDEWLERQKSFTPEFWEEYRLKHKGTGDAVAMMVREHFQAASKWDRMARNSVTQGTGACIMKSCLTSLFDYIVNNGLFNKIHICAAVHDEIVCDYDESLTDFPKTLEQIMEKSAAKFCKSLPIPAEAEIGDCWKH